jgi:hypothetical protein
MSYLAAKSVLPPMASKATRSFVLRSPDVSLLSFPVIFSFFTDTPISIGLVGVS